MDKTALNLLREEHLKSFPLRDSAKYVKSKLNGDLTIAEVGVRKGENAKSMLFDMSIKKLYLIDPYVPYLDGGTFWTQEEQDAYYFIMYHHIELFIDKVILISRSSVLASKLFSDEFFDWIYIDADHSYNGVMTDMKSWWPKVHLGGIMSGHDAGWEGVQKATKDFLMGYNYHLHNLNREVKPIVLDDEWIFEKK